MSDATYRSNISEELEKNGSCITHTVGKSMQPLFKNGRDAVTLVSARGKVIRKHDVVVYRVGADKYVLHRVIEFRGDTLVIRGDNTFVREYVPRDAIIGVMASFVRRGRRFSIDSLRYKVYSRLWNFIYPVRRALRAARSFAAKIKNKIMPKKRLDA